MTDNKKNPLLTASLNARVSNLKSLSEAFKDLEKQKKLNPTKLVVNGTASLG